MVSWLLAAANFERAKDLNSLKILTDVTTYKSPGKLFHRECTAKVTCLQVLATLPLMEFLTVGYHSTVKCL